MTQNPNGNTIIIAIIVPACFVVLLMTLLILQVLDPRDARAALTPASRHRHRTYLLPGLSHGVEAARKEERLQKRRDELENAIKTQHFYDWIATQKEKHPGSLLTTDPVW